MRRRWGTETIQRSNLVRSLASRHPGVEVWMDEEYPYQEMTYYRIVSCPKEGAVQNLAYVRVWHDRFQCQVPDENGTEHWISAK